MHQSILTYGEFVTYIRENVEAVLNEDREAEVVLTEVEKNNGVMSEIMTIRQERENFAPVFYMRDIYEQAILSPRSTVRFTPLKMVLPSNAIATSLICTG